MFTYEKTYDAYVHMFFASHYAEGWFENWSYKWYTGFNITSYPPLVHHIIALLSPLLGLKMGFVAWSLVVVALFVRGSYHFAALFIPEKALKYVAFVAVFSFSFTEALHVFGQLPSLTGISILLNACPFIYKWFRQRKKQDLIAALSLLALTTCAHHVTTIFGMVFFILPVIALALIDNGAEKYGIENLSIGRFIKEVQGAFFQAMVFGVAVIFLTVIVILPYWLWSKADPITQIPIPHGSRENFIEELNLGLVFFIIPWGMMLFALPYFLQRFFTRRYIFFGLSFTLLFILGTGGTTPIPRLLLGSNAFEILTLDRFTFWATVMALPIWGLLLYDLSEGRLHQYWMKRKRPRIASALFVFLVAGTLIFNGLIMNLGNFRPMQPDEIDIQPIVNFLDRDDHDKWRYLTLGFGDQMAWLSANTNARTIDGNYHSARRLPELTSRAVERLENAKYQGMEGIGALHQFLTVPQYFYLKYIFSNDKFYEPILYFTGWKRIGVLENNIVLWEKPDVPFTPNLLPRKELPKYQKWIWGVFPLTTLGIVLIIYIFYFKWNDIDYFCQQDELITPKSVQFNSHSKLIFLWAALLFLFATILTGITTYKNYDQISPENTVKTYFDAIDFKDFSKAYELFIPETYPGFENYILELSVNDGVLASYAKLDSLEIDISTINNNRVEADVDAFWITSLNNYQSQHRFFLEKQGSLWYIEPFDKDIFIPPDKFLHQAETDYTGLGRRSLITDSNEDVLDRPVARILSAQLVESSEGYHLVGEIINDDPNPAHLTVEGILYDSSGVEMGRYAVKDIMIHALLPQEKTVFRIDFEDTNWRRKSKKFTPDDRQTKIFERQPFSFALNVNTVVTDEEFYRNYGLEDVHYDSEGQANGEIFNYGTKEITVPQILYAAWHDDKIKWVDRIYLEQGIRPQRSRSFAFSLKGPEDLRWINTGNPGSWFVNGRPMNDNIDSRASRQVTGNVDGEYQKEEFRLLMNAFVNEINE